MVRGHVFLVLLSLVFTPAALAQSVEWTRVGGPDGASVARVDSWPERDGLVITTSQGVTYISLDRGASWSSFGSGRYPAFAGPDTVVSAHSTRFSVDGGTTWQTSPLPDSARGGHTAAINPQTGTVLVASRRSVARWTIGSQDIQVSDGPRFATLTWTGSVFVGMLDPRQDGAPVYVSTDDGKTWNPGSVPPGRSGLSAPLLHEGAWWTVARHGGNHPSLLFSTDGGITWGYDRTLRCLAGTLVEITDDELILAEAADVFAEELAGGSCRPLFSRTQISYLAGWRSQISSASITALPSGLLAITERGHLHLSRDSGASWDLPHLGGVPRTGVSAIHTDPRDGSWWVGTRTSGVFRSPDGGINWDYLGFRGLANVSSIVTGRDPTEAWVALQVSGLHRTTDGGTSWSLIPNQDLGGELAHAAFGSLEWSGETQSVIATWPVWDVFSSADGSAWTAYHVPARSRVDPPVWGSHLAVSGWLYVGMLYPLSNAWEVLRKRHNAPASAWEPVGGLLPAPAEQILETGEGDVYAGISFPFNPIIGPQGVYKVSPPDTTWQLVHGGVNPLEILETPDGTIWVLHTEGLLRSPDGLAFREGSTGLPGCLESLKYDPFWRELLAGSCYDGLYSLSLPSSVSTSPADDSRSGGSATHDFALDVFPLPADRWVNLAFDHAGGAYTVTVFDLLGRRLAVETAFAPPQRVHHRIDVSRLAAGSHLVHVESSGASRSTSLVLLR